MRRGIFTVEFLVGLVLAVVLSWRLPPFDRAIAVAALGNGYIVSRMLFKIRRGMFYSSLLSSEGLAYLLEQIPAILILKTCWYFIVINHVIFMLCRGKTKQIGVLTQYVHR